MRLLEKYFTIFLLTGWAINDIMNTENSEISESTGMANLRDEKEFLTTSQAARLLSVSPDTVLKWVKAGKITSTRTLGGHFRIPLEALERLAGGRGDVALGKGLAEVPAYQYCWEYLSRGGSVMRECRDCITYRSRSKRCYELRDLPEGMGCLRVYCESTCTDCDYYKMVSGHGHTVILLGENRRFFRDWDRLEDIDDIHIRFAEGEYECSAIIEKFRPDYIVIDCSLGKKRTATVVRNLFNDARIPVVRIILASRTSQLTEYCDKQTCGWITRPFDIEQLRQCIMGA